jgi:hypothetical protein
MAMKSKVYVKADAVRPYVERAMADEKLRGDVLSAFKTARKLYADLLERDGGRPVTIATRVATDEDVREKLASAIDDLRSASDRLHGRKSHSGRNTTLLLAGITLGVLYNPVTGPETRRFIRELLTGEPREQ